MQPVDPAMVRLFSRLSASTFRSRFRLSEAEYQYCLDKGAEVVMGHARDFIRQRLAAAHPANDGKQTPMRGHPVFVAQHATATCCRGCLKKWHRIPLGTELDEEQQRYLSEVLFYWLQQQIHARQLDR